eukprot:UN22907
MRQNCLILAATKIYKDRVRLDIFEFDQKWKCTKMRKELMKSMCYISDFFYYRELLCCTCITMGNKFSFVEKFDGFGITHG